LPVYPDPPDGSGVPVARDDGWPVAVNEEKLIDRDALCRMAEIGSRLRAQPTCTPFWSHAVASWYSSGTLRSADEINDRQVGNVAFDAAALHNVKSVSKRVASLALGIAIDRGLIGGVNQPIFGFFPALSDLRFPEKARMQFGARAHHVDGAEVGGGDPAHRGQQRRGAHAYGARSVFAMSSIFRRLPRQDKSSITKARTLVSAIIPKTT
jgi:hypothetical protein